MPPNFIVIFTDDQGYGDLGCYGSTRISSPNIDLLAEQGMRLTSFYTTHPNVRDALWGIIRFR